MTLAIDGVTLVLDSNALVIESMARLGVRGTVGRLGRRGVELVRLCGTRILFGNEKGSLRGEPFLMFVKAVSGGNFLSPYFQNTKSSYKTCQIYWVDLAWKWCVLLSRYVGLWAWGLTGF